MTPHPLVSVIIPAYNCAEYVGAAITSALTQTYPAVEVVVVDDGSTDATVEVVDGYRTHVTVVHRRNGGLAAARNSGIAASRGEFVTLCDADDFLLPDHVEQAVATASAAAPETKVWVSSPSMRLTATGVHNRRRDFFFGQPDDTEQLDAILATNFVSIFSTFPRRLYDDVGGFDEELRRCEDWDFWLRSILAGWRVRFATKPTALYRITPGSLSENTPQMSAAQKRVLQKAVDRDAHRLSPDQLAGARLRLSEPSYPELIKAARAALRQGELAAAQRLFRRAARVNPYDPMARRRARMLAPLARTTHVPLPPAMTRFLARRARTPARATPPPDGNG